MGVFFSTCTLEISSRGEWYGKYWALWKRYNSNNFRFNYTTNKQHLQPTLIYEKQTFQQIKGYALRWKLVSSTEHGGKGAMDFFRLKFHKRHDSTHFDVQSET